MGGGDFYFRLTRKIKNPAFATGEGLSSARQKKPSRQTEFRAHFFSTSTDGGDNARAAIFPADDRTARTGDNHVWRTVRRRPATNRKVSSSAAARSSVCVAAAAGSGVPSVARATDARASALCARSRLYYKIIPSRNFIGFLFCFFLPFRRTRREVLERPERSERVKTAASGNGARESSSTSSASSTGRRSLSSAAAVALDEPRRTSRSHAHPATRASLPHIVRLPSRHPHALSANHCWFSIFSRSNVSFRRSSRDRKSAYKTYKKSFRNRTDLFCARVPFRFIIRVVVEYAFNNITTGGYGIITLVPRARRTATTTVPHHSGRHHYYYYYYSSSIIIIITRLSPWSVS